MIDVGSFAQRNALDQLSNNPYLDRADQWTDESLSRVDLIDHWSENGFARKERHRSEILIRILPKERTLRFFLLGLFMEKIKMSCSIPFPVSSISIPVHSSSDVLKYHRLNQSELNFEKKILLLKCFASFELTIDSSHHTLGWYWIRF